MEKVIKNMHLMLKEKGKVVVKISESKVKKIKIGSEIFYQTNYGTKRYIVTTKEVIDEEDWSYLQETEDNRITLITCVSGQKEKRLCVQAIESSEGMDYGQ